MKKELVREDFFDITPRIHQSVSEMDILLKSNLYSSVGEFLDWPIDLDLKFLFVMRYTDMSYGDKMRLACLCAEFCLPYYTEKFPDDDRLFKCIAAGKSYTNYSDPDRITYIELVDHIKIVENLGLSYLKPDENLFFMICSAVSNYASFCFTLNQFAGLGTSWSFAYRIAKQIGKEDELLKLLKNFCNE